MGKQETEIGNKICIALSALGCKIFRYQVGLFYTQNGDLIHIGVTGHSDYCGHRPDGKAFYIETKTEKGRKRAAQEAFIKAMKDSGALAGFARNVEQALKIVTSDGYKFEE